LSNIVGAPPPPPLPNVPALDGNVPANLPVRERMAAHRANAVCANCHRTIDPVGFTLENFDAVGRWRDNEGDSGPIDVSGALPGLGDVKGVAGLEEALLRRPELFAATLTEKLLTFALGRGVEYQMRQRYGRFSARPSRVATTFRRSFWESSTVRRFR
jgi:hypothetical protein